MYYLGILSIIQLLFLPGIILLKLFRFPKGTIQNLIFIFGLSQIFNHLYVVILTHLSINYPVAHYLIFASELILFVYLYFDDLKKPINSHLANFVERQKRGIDSFRDSYFNEEDKFASSTKLIIFTLFFCWAIISISWAINYLIDNLGSVFTIWDSVVSWNHWAVEWFSNIHPENISRYSQLVPTNYSLTYSFMGSSAIQLFAKGFMPIFGLYFLLLILDLGLTKKSYAYLIGVVISKFLLKRFYNLHLGSGYVDAAVVFFTLLTVYTLLKPSDENSDQDKLKYLRLGSIFAAGTALTKQNGLLIVCIYPILAYLIILKDMTTISNKEKLKILLQYFGLSILLLLPWYVFNEIRILQGARTNVLILSSDTIHLGRSRIERLIKAYKDLGIYVYLYPLVLVTLPLMNKNIRKIIYFVLIPYSFIWALFFSYDTRNLSIGLAVLGVASGQAVAEIFNLSIVGITKAKATKLPLYTLVASILILVLAGGIYFSSPVLIEKQISKQRLILHEDLNEQLYNYFDEIGDYKQIFTNYPLRFLPGFEDKQVDIGGFEDIEVYREKRAQFPEVRYMLISLYKDYDEVLNEIYNDIDEGRAQIIFKMKQYLFVKIIQ